MDTVIFLANILSNTIYFLIFSFLVFFFWTRTFPMKATGMYWELRKLHDLLEEDKEKNQAYCRKEAGRILMKYLFNKG